MSDRATRPIPGWAWVLAALFFPSGLFLAYGYARLLSWPRSILLALLSYGCIIGFARTMGYLEQTHASEFLRAAALSAGIFMLCAWGFVLFRIGQAAAYWSESGRRAWRYASWFGGSMFVLSTITMVGRIFLE